MRFASLVVFLAACATGPAKIAFDGEATVTTHETTPLALQGFKALDKDGKPVESKEQPTFKVEPAEVATFDPATKQITPIADGEATVTATLGALTTTYKIVVGLPDEVKIDGAKSGDALKLGESLTLTAALLDRGNPIPNAAVTWESSDAAIATVDNGTVKPVAVGTVKIKATASGLSSEVELQVQEAAAGTAEAAPAAAGNAI